MAVRALDALLAIKVINLVPSLRLSDRRVGVTLIEHFNRQTGRCDPGIERISRLLGYCNRTIIRATQALEKAGLFRKVRHGGYSNRNSYEPVWSKFAELERAWNEKLRRPRLLRSGMSPAPGQQSHIGSDRRVTQTCTNNLPIKTCSKSQPSEVIGRTYQANIRLPSQFGKRPADAAHDEAERRWTEALQRMFVSTPVAYADMIEAIDDTMRTAASEAEMRCRGAGLTMVLQRLNLPGR